MQESNPKIENNEDGVIERLTNLINEDAHTKSLTVGRMALKDLALGNIDSALLRLKVDLDKIRVSSRELHDYVSELLDTRGLKNR